jgi:aspartyl-tRNA(Asn)/glutamyl-tRNA(Gln) amidotransferase subunit B
LKLVEAGTISGKQAKEVHAAMENNGRSPLSIVEERGMKSSRTPASSRPSAPASSPRTPDPGRDHQSRQKGRARLSRGSGDERNEGSANPKLVSEILERLVGG